MVKAKAAAAATSMASFETVTAIDISDKIKGGEAIDKAIKLVAGAYKGAHTLVQTIAVAIVQHAFAHGDCSRALPLVRSVPIQQARSLIQYFMSVSPIGVQLSEKPADDKVRYISKDSKSYNDYDIDKAKATNWWEMDVQQAQREATLVHAGGFYDEIMRLCERAMENESKAKTYDPVAVAAAKHVKALIEADRAKFLAAQGASTSANDTKKNEVVGKEKKAA